MMNTKLFFTIAVFTTSALGMEQELERDLAEVRLDLLIRKFGCSPDELPHDGEPLLHKVIKKESIRIDKFFLESYKKRGGDLSAVSKPLQNSLQEPTFPLELVIKHSIFQPELIKLFIECGARVVIANDQRMCGIHALCRSDAYERYLHEGGREDLVELFVNHGADVNACSIYGGVPLTSALVFGYTNIRRQLLRHNAVYSKSIFTNALKWIFSQKKDPQELVSTWLDLKRKSYLMAILMTLKSLNIPKDLFPGILAHVPDFLPDYCLATCCSAGAVAAILEKREQEKIRIIDEFKACSN